MLDLTAAGTAVAEIKTCDHKVHTTIQEHNAAVDRTREPVLDALKSFLAELSTSTVTVELPDELAGYITDVWAAGYAHKEYSDLWQPLLAYVDDLILDAGRTDWLVRSTSNPHLRNDQDVNLPLKIVLVRN